MRKLPAFAASMRNSEELEFTRGMPRVELETGHLLSIFHVFFLGEQSAARRDENKALVTAHVSSSKDTRYGTFEPYLNRLCGTSNSDTRRYAEVCADTRQIREGLASGFHAVRLHILGLAWRPLH